MGIACSMHVVGDEYIQCFGGKARRKENYDKVDVGGRIILKWILEK
jgi:hypothetical protein